MLITLPPVWMNWYRILSVQSIDLSDGLIGTVGEEDKVKTNLIGWRTKYSMPVSWLAGRSVGFMGLLVDQTAV